MRDPFDDIEDRCHDFDSTPEPDAPCPVVIGQGKAYCINCNITYEYSKRDVRRYCPGCCRTPNGR
jgi:hypothetical protein